MKNAFNQTKLNKKGRIIMKNHWEILIVLIVVFLGSCATPNEPIVSSDDQKLEIEMHYQTVGYARDFYLADENIFIAEDQGGISIFDHSGNFVYRSNDVVQKAKFIQVTEEDTVIHVYGSLNNSSPKFINYKYANLDSLADFFSITGNTDDTEDLLIKKTGEKRYIFYWTNNLNFKYAELYYNVEFSYWTIQYLDNNLFNFPTTLRRFDMFENMFFIAAEQVGVCILQMDDFVIDIKAYINTAGEARDVKFVDNMIFVACQEEGFEIIDVTDIDNPISIFQTDTSGYAQSIDVDGDLLSVASGGGGLYVYDISDLGNIKKLGRLSTEIGYTYKTVIKDGNIYAATKEGVFKISANN